MADEADAEHVVALALQPIGALVDVPHARHLERRALRRAATLTRRKRRYGSDRRCQTTSIGRSRSRILDRGDVGEIVVALRRIVVQPANDLVQRGRGRRRRRLAPDHVDALDGVAELGLQRVADGFAAPPRCGRSSASPARRVGASALPATPTSKACSQAGPRLVDRVAERLGRARRSRAAECTAGSWDPAPSRCGATSSAMRSLFDLLLQHHDAVDQAFGTRRTAGHVDVHRNDRVDALHHRVVVEHAAGRRARAHRDAPLRLRHLLPDAADAPARA